MLTLRTVGTWLPLDLHGHSLLAAEVGQPTKQQQLPYWPDLDLCSYKINKKKKITMTLHLINIELICS